MIVYKDDFVDGLLLNNDFCKHMKVKVILKHWNVYLLIPAEKTFSNLIFKLPFIFNLFKKNA